MNIAGSAAATPARRPLARAVGLLLALATVACDPTGPRAPKPAGTYELVALGTSALPAAHRQDVCPSGGYPFAGPSGFYAAVDSVISGRLRLGTTPRKSLDGSVNGYDFDVVWTVRTNEPEPGRPRTWPCHQAAGTWWEDGPGVVRLRYQFCVLFAGCDAAREETLVASAAAFGPGTVVEVTTFNGGVRGTFRKQ